MIPTDTIPNLTIDLTSQFSSLGLIAAAAMTLGFGGLFLLLSFRSAPSRDRVFARRHEAACSSPALRAA